MKKGYTLVELLTVLFIIALIFILVFATIVRKSKEFNSQSEGKQNDLIISSAKSYFYNNNELRQTAKNGKSVPISYQELKNKGYLRENLRNIETNEPINMETSCVCVGYNTSNYEYTFEAQQPCNCN